VVVDHNDDLLALSRRYLGAEEVLASTGPPGLSGARNSGLAAADSEVLAFLDDDAVAEPDWLAELCRPYADPAVIGVGGHVVPAWQTGRPSWFPAEFDWVVGCSHRGLPTGPASIRNPIGANMSFRTSALRDVGGFTTHIGRFGAQPFGCEETEAAIRIARRHPGTRIAYQPHAVVRHHVPPARATLRYFRARCWSEGLSKAEVARLTTAQQAVEVERRYATRTLPRGVLACVGEAVRHARPAAAARAAMIIAGLAITTAGYAAGRWGSRARTQMKALGT
jgi:glycosyltransferase involved in cell wall biosynthesis